MKAEMATWALVLAAGEGTRLRRLTTTSSGATIPKQFCSLRGGPSLLQEGIKRAGAAASKRHTCAIVARQHRHWWQTQLRSLPPENCIEQPENRGTANGILLPLIHILERDPGAQVILLPSDQHVRDEATLERSLYQAVEQLRERRDEIVLLGIMPEDPDPELGYIVPGRSNGGTREVLQFVEKPALHVARELINEGGMLNAFILASAGQTLLALLRRRIPEIVTAMRAAIRHDLASPAEPSRIVDLYRDLPTIDFSHDILPGQEAYMRVLAVPQCGWTDLGTPQRVAGALCAESNREAGYDYEPDAGHDCWSLAAQHERLQRAAEQSRPSSS